MDLGSLPDDWFFWQSKSKSKELLECHSFLVHLPKCPTLNWYWGWVKKSNTSYQWQRDRRLKKKKKHGSQPGHMAWVSTSQAKLQPRWGGSTVGGLRQRLTVLKFIRSPGTIVYTKNPSHLFVDGIGSCGNPGKNCKILRTPLRWESFPPSQGWRHIWITWKPLFF